MTDLKMTYVGGPTAVLEYSGLRFLTDPTFDPAGTEHNIGGVKTHKLGGPSLGVEAAGPIDAVLLSHDHHEDNLDFSGRAMLESAGVVLTTQDGAARLQGRARGLANWETVDLPASNGRTVRVTGTPGRHGPAGGDRGPVTGFVLDESIYVSGDTVWYEEVAEVARRFPIRVAVLFMGAARVAAAGPSALTMTAEDGVQAAHAFSKATLVPLHYEGWAHFTESRAVISETFAKAGLEGRVQWLEPGVTTMVR